MHAAGVCEIYRLSRIVVPEALAGETRQTGIISLVPVC